MHIEGKYFYALLDSGASVSLISPEIFDNIKSKENIERFKPKIRIKAVNGSEVRISDGFKIPVKINKFSTSIEFFLTEYSLQTTYQAILGYDFFKNYDAIIDTKTQLLKCSKFCVPIVESHLVSNCTTNSLSIKDFKFTPCDKSLKARLTDVLMSHCDVFATATHELAAAKITPHRIILEHDIPIKCPTYKIPFQLRDEFRKQIGELENADIIRRSKSQYNTPALFVKQKNKYRLVFDFRKLNDITITQDFVIPTLDDVLQEIAGSNYFSVLDMKSAFNQIPLHWKDRHKTAFTTPDGLKYEFNRLCFGLKNSPKAFQEIAQEVLGDKFHNGALVYIDDIILFSSSVDEHLNLIDTVLRKFKSVGLKFNPEKCQFLTKRCKFLGFIVSHEGVSIDKDDTETINDFPIPKTQKEVKSFLGCCNFYRRHIKNFSKRAHALTSLLRKDMEFIWSDETQSAFDDIKRAILNPPVLALPDFSLEFQVTTDASSAGIGAILEQKYSSGEVKPIYFYSKKLNPTQSKYSATVLEFYAIYSALNFFRPFLIGQKKFFVYTDHKPLEGFLTNKNPANKILRWKLALEEFNYEIKYVRGTQNVVADHLSRSVNASTIVFPTDIELIQMQSEDPELKRIIEKLKNGEVQVYAPNSYFLTEEGLLMHLARRHNRSPRDDLIEQVCVPHVLKGKVLESVHSEVGGHLRFFKTYHRLFGKFFWKRMYSDTKNFINSCEICLARRSAVGKVNAPHQPVQQSVMPGECCHMDIFGPLITTSKGNSYILSMIDAFSKSIQLVAVPDVKSEMICRAMFDNYIVAKGCPRILITDNATYFKSDQFSEFCRIHGIEKRHISDYSAHVNGRVEKPNQSIANILAALSKENKEWDELVPQVMLALNSSIHEATHTSPFFLEHGRDMRLPYSLHESSQTFASKYDYIENLLSKLPITFQKVLENLNVQEQKHIKHSERKTKIERFQFPIGSLCYLLKPNIKSNLSKKLRPKYLGPFRIIDRLSPVNYVLRSLDNPRKTLRSHVNRMSPFEPRHSYLHIFPTLEDQETALEFKTCDSGERKPFGKLPMKIPVKIKEKKNKKVNDGTSREHGYSLRKKERIFYNSSCAMF